MRSIAVVEDDREISEILKYGLEREGFKVKVYNDGESFLNSFDEHTPDLVILDIMLPGIDGFEVCKTLRKMEKTSRVPIIMLTAKGDEIDRVLGLELGADDYIVKPFSLRELIARIKAIFRRISPAEKIPSSNTLTFGPITLKVDSYEVFIEGKRVRLTLVEFKILHLLMENAGKVLTRDFLLDSVLGYGADVYSRTVDVHIANLRKKLGRWGKLIKTVRGLGYKLEATDE